jgi:hypothetical protein
MESGQSHFGDLTTKVTGALIPGRYPPIDDANSATATERRSELEMVCLLDYVQIGACLQARMGE